LIKASLHDVVDGSDEEFTAPEYAINGVECVDRPVCSLVIAPYECQSWLGAR
jgi:hypothetical protein